MRRAKARRLCKWLFAVDQNPYDIYAECVKIGGEPFFNFDTKNFYFKVDRGAREDRIFTPGKQLFLFSKAKDPIS